MDPEIRQLRYFVAVARERNFTRAAAELNVAQQALSAAIQRLERRLGTQLLVRSTRSVELTAAGAELLEVAEETIARLEDGLRRVRAAVAGMAVVRIGMVWDIPGVERLIEKFRTAHPSTRVEVRNFDYTDPTAGLLAGETDLAFAWQPLGWPEIATIDFHSEPRVFLMADSHPLASRAALTAADVADQPAFDIRGADTSEAMRAWRDFWQLQPRADGSRRPAGALVANIEEWRRGMIEADAITTAPASVPVLYPWPGLRAVPAAGVVPAWAALAYRSGQHNPAVTGMRAVLRTTLGIKDPEVGAPRRPA